MKILTWNVRGLSGSTDRGATQAIVSKIISSHAISFACLFETKLSTLDLDLFLSNRFPSWESCTNSDFVNGGRMLLIWDTYRVSCTVLEVHSHFIHVQALCKVTQVSFLATFVYPGYTPTERKEFWQYLTQKGAPISRPWLVLGDFNFDASPMERVGGSSLIPSAYEDLYNFMQIRGMVDAPSSGPFFTWTNGTLCTKLDRVLINDAWSDLGLVCMANFMEMEPVSDHVPVVTTVVNAHVRGNRPFKFFNMWINHPSFEDIIGQYWGLQVEGSLQFVSPNPAQ